MQVKGLNSSVTAFISPITIIVALGVELLRAQMPQYPNLKGKEEKPGRSHPGGRTTCLATSFLARWEPGGAKEHL